MLRNLSPALFRMTAAAAVASSSAAAPTVTECYSNPEPGVEVYSLAIDGPCNDPVFRVIGSDNDHPVAIVTQETDGRYNLTIISNENDYDGGGFTVYVFDPGVRFGLLRVVTPDNEPNHDVTLTLGGDFPIESIDYLGAIVLTNETYDLAAKISLLGGNADDVEVLGDVGTMIVHEVLFQFQINGDLGALATASAPVTVVKHITDLDIGDDLLGALLVSDAMSNGESIGTLTVQGRMGYNNASTPNQLAAGDVRTAGSVGLIRTGEVGPAAHIEVGISTAGPAPIGEFEVSNVFAGATGDFRGALSASTVDAGSSLHQIRLLGDLSGDFSFDEAITNHTDDAPVIMVDGAFKSGGSINLPTNGLQGQIIFSRANLGAPWQSGAEVSVGSIDLSTTLYTAPASSIGGGAAGLAEFRLHLASCDPPEITGNPPTREPGLIQIPSELTLSPDGLTFECVPTTKPSAVLQFFGPVGIHSLPAVTIHRWVGGAWALQASTGYTYAESVNGDEKRVSITPVNDWVGGSYRVTRQPGALNSLQVANASPTDLAGVNAFTYYFDVEVIPCEGQLLAGFDLNSDQAVTEPGDVPAWLVSPEDFNADATTDTTDMRLLRSAAALYGGVPDAPEYFLGPYVDVE